jgi:hypothetical protein
MLHTTNELVPKEIRDVIQCQDCSIVNVKRKPYNKMLDSYGVLETVASDHRGALSVVFLRGDVLLGAS